jgi:hypothetical protein
MTVADFVIYTFLYSGDQVNLSEIDGPRSSLVVVRNVYKNWSQNLKRRGHKRAFVMHGKVVL